MRAFFLGLWLLPALAYGQAEFPVTATSWNVNSVAKIRNDPKARSHFSVCDVIFLQETLHTRTEDCLTLPGFVGHHNLAIPTNRRPSRGVSSFFRIETFVDGSVSQVSLLTLSSSSFLVASLFFLFFHF
jgi:exonuclease III